MKYFLLEQEVVVPSISMGNDVISAFWCEKFSHDSRDLGLEGFHSPCEVIGSKHLNHHETGSEQLLRHVNHFIQHVIGSGFAFECLAILKNARTFSSKLGQASRISLDEEVASSMESC